ncbi:MAG: YjbQ family protein, partial [Planctomycetota bacterium]
MKTLTKEIWMDVSRRRQIISIHNEVEQLVTESGVQEGIVLVNAMHITASVFINDNESGLHHDYEL